jgi:transcriptional regulator with XRE-family HTH domain/GTPase SAR1 family protein
MYGGVMSPELDGPISLGDRRATVPVRRQELKPIPDDVTPESRRLAETLRGLYDSNGTTLRRLAAEMHFSAANVSRYLSGQRPPPREFVEKLLRLCYDNQGSAVTVEVEQLVFKQRLAALKSSKPALYKIELLNDQLAFALTEKRACDNTVLQLEREIEESRSRIYDLEREKRQILASWDDERRRSDEAAAEEGRQRDELEETIRRLKRQVDQLNEQLDRALNRAEAAEERCLTLEAQIDEASTLIEDVEDELPVPAPGQPTPADPTGTWVPANRGNDVADYYERSPVSVSMAANRAVKIGLWGSPQSGKTTYLAALRHATNATPSDYGTWSMVPLTAQSSDLLVELTKELNSGQFPAATILGGFVPLSWMFFGDITRSKFVSARQRLLRRGPVMSEFVLDLIDASGHAFSDDREWDGASPAVAHAVFEHLLDSDGLIYLFDPLGERENRDAIAFVNRTISELKRRHYERTGQGGRLPHQLSICVTKFDQPEVLLQARAHGLVHMGPDGPRVRDEAAKEFFEALCTGRFWSDPYEHNDRSASFVMRELQSSFAPENIDYFVTSSIGFYRSPGWRQEAPFDPEVFRNYFAGQSGDGPANPRIRGMINPINVLEPLISVQQRIVGRGR